ncbi:MAG: TlyA family rRNA (cytidine-2'-O)-methyltransferase [Phycisphaeraceae bacterium]|nr:MAG: TlyA family rRNA (cytidine-2'-O)-methyltransferase [Phycisphaeraceae bacterium]
MSGGAYASRGGLKLEHGLGALGINPAGLVCADLGCSTGGFTDCLLKHGAARVYAVDTAYGQLAWTLRNDPRVVVMERTNALHATPPAGGVALVVADMSWTPQRLVIPAALRWLSAAEGSVEGEGMGVGVGVGVGVVTLIKPHYEAREVGVVVPRGGVLGEEEAERIAREVCGRMGSWGARVLGLTKSPVLGGGKGAGNAEWLAWVTRA